MHEIQQWDDRFAVPDYVFGKEPNAFLVSCGGLLPASGTALAVADGEGRNGVWLARNGLDVLSLDASRVGQSKARTLAREAGVTLRFEIGDVHAWTWPEAAFDVVAAIFTQFSSPTERLAKWAGMRRALKPGGLLIIQGYTPRQLKHGTGGPKVVEQLYTRALLEESFGDLQDIRIVEEERLIDEGMGHRGMSAIIGMTARC